MKQLITSFGTNSWSIEFPRTRPKPRWMRIIVRGAYIDPDTKQIINEVTPYAEGTISLSALRSFLWFLENGYHVPGMITWIHNNYQREVIEKEQPELIEYVYNE